MVSRKGLFVFRVVLAGTALAACGQGEEPRQEGLAPLPTTQATTLQCDIESTSLANVPGIQRLTACGSQAGSSLHAGDVDGDGLSDVVVGAPADLGGRGSVCLVLGNDRLDLSGIATRSSGDTGARAGQSVVVGDFAGAGSRLDLAVGGIGHNSSRGAVYAMDGTGLSTFSLPAAPKYLGVNPNDEAGAALAVGDVTGDGRDDLVLSAPNNESNSAQANSGIVYIVKNTGVAPASTNLSFNNINILRVQNIGTTPIAQTDLNLGKSVAIADLNGDGKKDLIIGIPGYDGAGGADTGAVFVFYGPLAPNETLAGADLKLLGASAGERAGSSLARVGDLNADGKEDILVGAPGSGSAVGKAYLVYGGLTASPASLGSSIVFTGSAGDRAGTSLTAGDFNADGKPDMLVGAPGHQGDKGAVFLIPGDAVLLPSQSLASYATFEGETAGDKAGQSVASAGDFNGDGVADIVIGAPNGNGGMGVVYLIRGEVPRQWYSDTDGDGFGSASVATPVLDCVPPPGQWVSNELDCDDGNVSIHPDALELCSTAGVDDNCNGSIDEDGATDAPFWAKDTDNDQYADAFESLVQTCVSPGTGWTRNDDVLGSECLDPASDNDTNTHENANEVCDDKDNNCNGEVDDGNAGIWYVDVDGDGYGSDGEFFPYTAPCGARPKPGYVNNKDDCNDRDGSVNPKTRWYRDNDGDGVGNNAQPYRESCTKPAGPWVRGNNDCNDDDNTVSPLLAEVCEPELSPQKDNNCNGNPNDTLAAITWFLDDDGDGEGSSTILGRFCGKPAKSSKITGDCDDNQAQAFHGNEEVCEAGNYAAQIDNNCNGQVNDTAQAVLWMGDGDDDDYRGTVFSLRRCDDPNPGGVGGGDDDPSVGGEYLPVTAPVDCNDSDASATVVRIWYEDKDGNGCGNPNVPVSSCHQPVCGVPFTMTAGPGCT
jgi:hypothetical protein